MIRISIVAVVAFVSSIGHAEGTSFRCMPSLPQTGLEMVARFDRATDKYVIEYWGTEILPNGEEGEFRGWLMCDLTKHIVLDNESGTVSILGYTADSRVAVTLTIWDPSQSDATNAIKSYANEYAKEVVPYKCVSFAEQRSNVTE